MSTVLRVYANTDDTLLFWSVPGVIVGCLGFSITRRTIDASGSSSTKVLDNYVGFADVASTGAGQPSSIQPSTVWPFQRFSWIDHSVPADASVSYQVVPLVRDGVGTLTAATDQASDWSSADDSAEPDASGYAAYFNRGFVISQFMAHYLAENKLSPKQFKLGLGSKDEQAIRIFLSGRLRTAMLAELHAAQDGGGEVFAALFELADDELIGALRSLGARAHVVLANGSVKTRGDDENATARATLLQSGVDVEADNRFVAPAALGHNKFMVRTDASGTPVSAWTGSTNWTPTGLCTQLNNGLLIKDAKVCQIYLDQWHRLRDAASSFPPGLVDANSAPHETPPDPCSATVWFSRTHQQVDLAALKSVVDSAKEGILFLMFMPGNSGVLSYIDDRLNEPGLYIRGVVSELPNGRGDESKVDVSLVNGSNSTTHSFDVVQPEGIKYPFANFAAEVTHNTFVHNIGFAIIHSKVLVIDPFSDTPVVVTGSHNFSKSASSKNDENFIVVSGDKALAQAYTVNVFGAYDHYEWRAAISGQQNPAAGLVDDDTWMAPRLAAAKDELAFFGAQ